MHEILTPAQMRHAEQIVMSGGSFDGYALMRRAGAAVAHAILARRAGFSVIDVLCGPGNNGGDGYVVAALLAEQGCEVRVFADGPPKPGTDAERAAADCPLPVRPLAAYGGVPGSILVDAVFGAGFRGSLRGEALAALGRRADDCFRVAIDLPSGLDGRTARGEAAFAADLTVTFARRKPAHVLYPGRELCGELVVADIGIPDRAIAAASDPTGCSINGRHLWGNMIESPDSGSHKYSRGHCAVFSGGAVTSGASRLAAAAAARGGAGAVTLLAPAEALSVNAAHMTAIMLARLDGASQVGPIFRERRVASAVIGPGFGVGDRLREVVLAALDSRSSGGEDGALAGGIVLDADAITAFAGEPDVLFAAVRAPRAPDVVMTPHEGEFRRLFPEIAADESLSKIDRARRAAAVSGAVVVYKGPDTVIADPQGRAAVNTNGTPWLATAGSGDVLAGLIGGLLARRMPPFEAACAAVHLHAEAARRLGPGLIAEDLVEDIPTVLAKLLSSR